MSDHAFPVIKFMMFVSLLVLITCINFMSNESRTVPLYTAGKSSGVRNITSEMAAENLRQLMNTQWVANDYGGMNMLEKGPMLFHDYWGRLGNHLFQYASTYGIATHNGATLVLGKRNMLLTMFPLIKAVPIDEKLYLKLRSDHRCRQIKANEKSGRRLLSDNQVLNQSQSLATGVSICLNGFLESRTYFWAYVHDIKEQLKLSPELSVKAEHWLQQISKTETAIAYKTKYSNVTFVGVHVRRSDYPRQGVAPANYTHGAMNWYRKAFPNCLFVVASDDPEWCKSQFSSNDTVFTSSYNITDYRVDFAILTKCNHTIRTQGTYGWWASFLAGGLSVYYNGNHSNDTSFNRPDEIAL